MSFWRTFGFQSVSPIDTILERDHFTLEDLLDEDDILTECKGQNKKLLEFLVNPDVLMKLVNYILDSPSHDEEKLRYKYSYLACEILCLDIWDISEAIFASEVLLTSLWGFFSKPAPLDSLVCSYLTRICGVLLQRQIRESFVFLQQQPDVVSGFVTHLENPTVTELLLKLVSCDEVTGSGDFLNWLLSCELVPQMLSKLTVEHSSTLHENVVQTFESILEQIPLSFSSRFITVLSSDESLDALIACLSSPSKSVFISSLTILSKLLERSTREETTLDLDPIDSLSPIIQRSVAAIDQLVARLALVAPLPAQDFSACSFDHDRIVSLPASYNQVITPIGPERLKILEFFSTLIRLRYSTVDAIVMEKGIIKTAFDLFVAYPWNNFLHTNVRNLISDVFSGINLESKIAILEKGRLLDILIDLAAQNDQFCNGKGISSGKGYMGFVTQMSNGIQHACSADPSLAKILTDHPAWKSYAEGLLEQTNSIEKTDFGEPRAHAELRSDSSSEDSPDYSGPNQELVSVFKQYLSTHQFNGNYPNVFPDHEEDEDEYDDDDTAAPEVSTEQLVLDRTFEQDALPYSTNISGYYDIPGEDSSSEEEEDEKHDAEFDPHEDSDDSPDPPHSE